MPNDCGRYYFAWREIIGKYENEKVNEERISRDNFIIYGGNEQRVQNLTAYSIYDICINQKIFKTNEKDQNSQINIVGKIFLNQIYEYINNNGGNFDGDKEIIEKIKEADFYIDDKLKQEIIQKNSDRCPLKRRLNNTEQNTPSKRQRRFRMNKKKQTKSNNIRKQTRKTRENIRRLMKNNSVKEKKRRNKKD